MLYGFFRMQISQKYHISDDDKITPSIQNILQNLWDIFGSTRNGVLRLFDQFCLQRTENLSYALLRSSASNPIDEAYPINPIAPPLLCICRNRRQADHDQEMITKLTQNVFVQESLNQQLNEKSGFRLDVSRSKRRVRLGHIVNFYSVGGRLLFLPFTVPALEIWNGLLRDLEIILQLPKALMQPRRMLKRSWIK
jgi:hypothetical protein